MASMLMPTQGGAPLAVAHYAILDQQPDGNLMQSIALKCWNLREPKVLISVTGGAQDFSMSRSPPPFLFTSPCCWARA
eukprot:3151807-Rhodomonas_salina.1